MTKPKTAMTTVVDDPHVTGEFNAEYAANRRDDEDPLDPINLVLTLVLDPVLVLEDLALWNG